MAGPTAPLIVAATALGALGAFYSTRNKQVAPAGLAGLGRPDSSSSSSSAPGISVRPVAYRHNAETSLHYGQEQQWARQGTQAGGWKYVI